MGKKAYKQLKIREVVQPWTGKDLSLKINEHDQTIWKCVLELMDFTQLSTILKQ